MARVKHAMASKSASHFYEIVVGKLWAFQHFLLGRATLSVVGRVVCKSYSPVLVAWTKTCYCNNCTTLIV